MGTVAAYAGIMKIAQPGVPAASGTSSTKKLSETTNGKSNSGSFADVLKKSVEKVNTLQNQADAAINDLVLGNSKDVTQTMVMMEKADISFRLMMQVRNKIIQAYEEIMRT